MERLLEARMGMDGNKGSDKLLLLMSLVAFLIGMLLVEAGHITSGLVAFCSADGLSASRWVLPWYRRRRASASSPGH
jgi:hypothetical protein